MRTLMENSILELFKHTCSFQTRMLIWNVMNVLRIATYTRFPGTITFFC